MMSVEKEFKKQFRRKETDLIVLIEDSVTGAGVLKDNLLSPTVRFIASVDPKNDIVSKDKGILTWLYERKDEVGYGFPFKKYQICKVKVRKNIPIQLKDYMSEIVNNRYLLTEVIDYDVKHVELQEMADYLSKPVIIEETFGTFELDRTYDSFEGSIEWLDKKVRVDMQTDAEPESVTRSLTHLKILINDEKKWDDNFKGFAAKELTDLANDWSEDETEITEEAFMSKIELESIGISRDGGLLLYYSDGDLFWGHVIEIDANISGELISAQIAG